MRIEFVYFCFFSVWVFFFKFILLNYFKCPQPNVVKVEEWFNLREKASGTNEVSLIL